MTRHKARSAPRKARQPSEHSIQSRFIQGLERIPHPAVRLTYAIVNQAVGGRYARQAYFAAEGLRAGLPDLHLPYPTRQHPGLWIEFKRPGERPRPNQLSWHEALRSCGHRVEVCHSAEEGWRVVCEYLGVALPEELAET